MPTQQPFLHRDQGPQSILLYLIRWMVSIGAGAATYLGATRSPIAVLAVIWYAFVTTGWLLALLIPDRRDVALVYVLPRVVCTAIALGAYYRTGWPWDQVIVGSFVTITILEGAIHLLIRVFRPEALNRAKRALDGTSRSTQDGATRMGTGRIALAATSALLFALVFSTTATVFFVRQIAFDTQFTLASLHSSGLYEGLVQLASEAALDAARSRGAGARQAANYVSEEDVRLAEHLILPEPWTSFVLADSIDATLDWLESDDSRSMPAISLPLEDLERHIKDAASVVLDRHIPDLPLCTPDMPSRAYCRPKGMSVAAFAATFKPGNMAVADKTFALIPAELDLATAATMFPGPFRKPLAYLASGRQAVRALDRALPIAGIACLALFALTWFFAANTPSNALRWIGAALLVAGLGSWAASWILSTVAPHVSARWARDLFTKLPGSVMDAVPRFAQELADAVHARLQPWALAMAGLGLALALVGLLAPKSGNWTRRLAGQQTVQVVVFALAASVFLWTVYLYAGRQAYNRAVQADRRGQPAEACAHYRQIESRYPLDVDRFIRPARRGWRECQLYLDAESAYRSADYETAVGLYEAFLLGNPAIAIRHVSQAHLLDALLKWGRALDDAGDQERALDRYRFVRDSGLDRGGHLAAYGQDVRIHKTIANLYLAWGDELLAAGEAPADASSAGDPQAAVATYRRILQDTGDPGLWDQAESRMVDAYCAWVTQLHEQGQADRAAGLCLELALELPSIGVDRCVECTP